MTEILEMYKCNVCGNLVEVVLSSYGELVCCNQPMELIEPKQDEDEVIKEHHLPFIEHKEDGIEIRVGEKPHPMQTEHYIQFIEACSKDKKYIKRKYLHAGEEPILKVKCDCEENLNAKTLCNIHGFFLTEG